YAQLWSLYYLVMVIAEVPLGWLADRLGKRPLLVAGPATLAASFALLGRSVDFDICLVAMAVTGAGHAMISGADSAYLYELLIRENRREDALQEESLAHRWRLFGVSLADLSGGFVAWWWGTSAAFDLSALLMIVAVWVAWRLPSLPPERRAPHETGVRPLLSALASPEVLWVFAWYAVIFVLLRIGFQLYQPSLLAAGAHDLRIHGGLLSLLNLVAGVSAIAVGVVYQRLGERGTIVAVLALVALSFLGLSLLGPWAMAPLFCLQQVSFAFLQPLGRTALNHRITSSDRASLLSAQSMAARLAFSLALVGGSWDQAVSTELPQTYLALAGVTVAFAIALFCLRPGQGSSA
ncbi:MAG: putative MFS family arabinose efflux permease, partial [Pseudohongiellaceae bacterium]